MGKILYSRGVSKFDNQPEQLEAEDFAAFAEAILSDLATKKGEQYICAPFCRGLHDKQEKYPGEGYWRLKKLALPRRWLPIDYDGFKDAAACKSWQEWLAEQNLAAVVYTTFSHRADAPRARAIVELSRAVTREESLRLGALFEKMQQDAVGQDAFKFDASVYQHEQPCYLPGSSSKGKVFTGGPLDVDALLAAPRVLIGGVDLTAAAIGPDVLTSALAGSGGGWTGWPGHNLTDGQDRRRTMLRYAGYLRSLGHPQETINQLCLEANAAHMADLLEDAVVTDLAARYQHQTSPAFSTPPTPRSQATTLAGAALDVVDRTDAGNVAVLYQVTGGNLRFVLERKTFMAWDAGQWKMDYGGRIAHQQALRVAEEYQQHAQKIRSGAQQAHISEKERKHLEATAKSLENWSQQCRNKHRLDAMLGLAQRDMRFVIQASELDRDPFLLGVANGTVNLRTGLLQPNSRSDFVTKRCPVAFNPTATAPRWRVFISEITSTGGILILGALNRKERRHLARYLQTALGYCLTGSTEEQVMFILIGNGSNGKNVLLDTFKAVGGEYIETIAPEVLMAAKFDNGADQASPSTRTLAGARAAISSESKEGQKLDVSVVKRHTGGGFITARGLHESPMTFEITHKLLLMTNPEPSVDHMDDATRGRLHMIPFDMKWNRPGTTNPDPNLPDAQKDLMEVLRKEQEGILLWLVQGAVAYVKEGLAPPKEVIARTQSYLDSQDSFKQWAEGYEKCAPCDGATAGTLYDQYSQLCREEALPIQIASAAALGKKMKASGYENLKTRDGMKYGLRTKKIVDDPPAPAMKAILAAWGGDKASDGAVAVNV